MRSRYAAFALGLDNYLLATWHRTTRPAAIDHDDTHPPKWIGLQVMAHRQLDAEHAEVEFLARYRVGGRAHRLHELSRFVREDGRWFYVDGTLY